MELIRGDTHSKKFRRKYKDGEIITEKADNVYFSVKNSYYSKECLFQKRLSDDSIRYDENDNYYRFTIEPEDTDNLPYDDYVYDIEVIVNGKKKTIAKGTLKITGEVTHADNEV